MKPIICQEEMSHSPYFSCSFFGFTHKHPFRNSIWNWKKNESKSPKGISQDIINLRPGAEKKNLNNENEKFMLQFFSVIPTRKKRTKNWDIFLNRDNGIQTKTLGEPRQEKYVDFVSGFHKKKKKAPGHSGTNIG